ncbi:C25 family cysteine peptidase [Lewinella sp. IMCC34183]|uniref:putative type IX secretion system sortase PorU2 n=1 Tax=Lewinella sp. IMCC34183 TaxID=2248762 RepID=UPI001300AF2A|nr:C25 family cysteine peptidase [Lewinella sp. IMCC34183]
MQRIFTFLFLYFAFTACLQAQIPTSGDTLFGNEWITPGQVHLRIDVADDGFYRIDPDAVAAAGLPATESDAQRYRLYHCGQPVPIEVSEGRISFYGKRTRGEMDTLLFPGGRDELLNPRYSMYTDTAAYYLTTTPALEAGERYAAGTAGSTGPASATIRRTAEQLFTDQQSKYYRRSSGSTIMFSHYELAEGYGLLNNNQLLSSNGSTISAAEVNLPNGVAGTMDVTVRFGLAFGDTHQQRVSINGATVDELTSEDWSVTERTYTVSGSGTRATLRMEGLAGKQDKANLAYVRVEYPATPTLTGDQLRFHLPAGDAVSLDFGTAGASARLYDLTNGTVYTPAGGTFALPGSGARREFALVRAYLAPVAAVPVSFADLLPDAGDTYLLLTSRRLAGTGVETLAAYRETPVGGGHGVHVVYVEDLYEQFGYGIRRHPQSIRNYLAGAYRRAPGLDFLFIVGKGREYLNLRKTQGLAEAWSTFFVPSFGVPASDNLLSAELNSIVPRLATGRLAAITPEEVLLYARKLMAVERQITEAGQNITDLDWMKQALFLGGGGSVAEQEYIRYNLGTMQRIFETSKFGGNVTNVFRTSSEPIEDARQEIIFDRINAGTSLIVFHGHSSSQGFDFNIDNPENYDNVNRYPFMISLGCYSGDAFTEARSISERFIFLEDGGAVTFAASKGLGYISALGTFGRAVTNHLSNDQYGMGVGSAIRSAIADYATTTNFTLGILLEQFALSGDPAFRLHPRPGPDLVVDPASVAFEPRVVPAQDTGFTVRLRLLNLGTRAETLPDSTVLLFRQQLPSGEIRELGRRTVAVPHYDEVHDFLLPTVGLEAVGANRLLVTVDVDGTLTELPGPAAEANNELIIGNQPGAPLTVVANSAKTAFPPDFALVGPGVELIAGSTDPLAPERTYRIQLAADPNFATPLLDEELTSPGGVLRYRPQLTFADSTTYYWRISPDSSRTDDEGYLWDQSSFTYVADRPADKVGYAIQDPGQFIRGESENINLSATQPDWNFARTANDVEIYNGVYEDRAMPRLALNGLNLNSPHPWKILVGIQVLVIDSISNARWYPNPGDGQYNTPPGRASVWSFDTREEAGREGLVNFLDEYVQEGQYVLLWSVQRGKDLEYHGPEWQQDSLSLGRTVYQVLEEQGAEQTRLLESLGSVPYTFIFQKGLGPIAEAVATSQDANTHVLFPIRENWADGRYAGPRVGPSLEWRSLRTRFQDRSIGEADSCYFRLYGFDREGNRSIIREQGLPIRSIRSFTFDLTDVDAATYPYLQPEFLLLDETDRTVASLDDIYFDYQRPGDAAISPAVAYSVPERLDQGQLARLEVGYENLTPTPMDSLLVQLTVYDAQNNVTLLRRREPPLAAGGSGVAAFDLPTQELNTSLRVELRLNPDDDQPEDILFNNRMNTDLGVGLDYVAPDLKVYYDGRTIRDGELVSATPEIRIQLRDENEFRRLTDSSAYYLRLAYPDGAKETVRLSDERVEFVPAGPDGDNMAEIFFRPELTNDGIYSLTVRATDRANNPAGRLDYEQRFEVINQQLIANVLTYPNPFTTQTRFVYTLTGSVAPEVFRIQIMTVSGRVVRDIDLLAYENISVGTHQTDFAWDGTDEYGDLLANGVYLYRVITSDSNGSALEKHDNGTDQYFDNGFGKVVILR